MVLRKFIILSPIIILIFLLINIFYISASEDDVAEIQDKAIEMLNQQSYDAAITLLEKAINLDRANAKNYFLIGIAYNNKKNYNSAIVNYKRAIDFDSKYGDAYYNIASSYYYQGKIDLTVKWLEKAKPIFYEKKEYKRYEIVLKKLISLTGGETRKEYEAELDRYFIFIITTPTPAIGPVPTYLPGFKNLDGVELAFTPPYTLTIEDKPFDKKIIFNSETKKIYVPAEIFLKILGLKGYYDTYTGDYILNGQPYSKDFIRLGEYQELYISLIDTLNFLRISHVYNEVLGKPVVIVKLDGAVLPMSVSGSTDYHPYTHYNEPTPTPTIFDPFGW